MTSALDAQDTQAVDVAILVALGLEAAPLVDRLHNPIKLTAANGLKIAIGQLKERRVAVVTTGVGSDAAIRGTRLTIEGHRPGLLVAAGLCGGLAPDLERGRVVVGTTVMRPGGRPLAAPDLTGLLATARLRTASVVTADRVVDTPEAKRELRGATAGDIVDMESWYIAEAAEAAGTRWAIVRSVSDTADERIPPDVAKLASVTHPARLAGAAARLLFFRTSAISDLAELREHACSAADRLAEAVDVMLGRS
jgi:nucleoside phosphorylase